MRPGRIRRMCLDPRPLILSFTRFEIHYLVICICHS
ncbi:hypothetical protein LINPERPRIM_LOCUS721 [Linum perenne]